MQAYDTQIRLQAQQMYVSTAVSNLASANQMAEASQQLGTGATQVQASNFQNAVASQYQSLAQQVAQSREEIMESLTQSYEQVITNLLGEQDLQGNFENILAYQENAQLALDSLLMSIAEELNMGSDTFEALNGETPENYSYEEFLLERGYLSYTETPGEYEVTDKAIAMFDRYLNEDLTTVEATERLNTIASNMAKAEYGSEWDEMDEDDRAKAMIPYKEWFYENQIGLRYTTFGLWDYDESGNVQIDTIWEAPNINDSDFTQKYGYEFTGDVIDVLEARGGEDSALAALSEQAIAGNIEDDSIVLFDGDYYVYYQNYFYKTAYSLENPPAIIPEQFASTLLGNVLDSYNFNIDNFGLDDGMSITLNGNEYIIYNDNLYTADSYFYENDKLYKINGKFKKSNPRELWSHNLGTFGRMLTSWIFTNDRDKWHEGESNYLNSTMDYYKDIAKYNAELKKNATEVK